MADTRKILIEIRLTGSNGTPKPDPDEKPSETALQPTRNSEKALGAYSVLLNQAYQNAKSLVTSAVNYGVNKYFSLREDYIGETDWNATKSILGLVSGFATTTVAGVMAGGVAGGIIASVGYGAMTALNYAQRWDTAMISLSTGNIEREYASSRTGGNRNTEN